MVCSSGIYVIINEVTGDCYVGQAQNVRRRWWVHRADLNGNRSKTPILFNAWQKYGEKSFTFHVLTRCPIDDLLAWELYWYLELNPRYNCGEPSLGGARGHRWTWSVHRRRKQRVDRRFTDDEVRQIRQDRVNGLLFWQIADQRGVSESCIQHIVNGLTYKDVV